MFLAALQITLLALGLFVEALPSVTTLDASAWTLENRSKNISTPAIVPGSVHLDLERAQIIGNPYYGEFT